jgi:peptidylprolyl isomerase
MSYAIENDYKKIENDYTENHVTLVTKNGNVVIKLFPEMAPNHVERIQYLVKKDFYNGLKFHRVIDGFMVQTGCPKSNGTGGSDLGTLKAECNNNNIPHVKGTVSMARSDHPDSANSQFFIMLGEHTHLDKQYTAFGQVISGMDYVDKIKKGDAKNNGTVDNPDEIIKMYLGMPEELHSSSDHAAPSPFIN